MKIQLFIFLFALVTTVSKADEISNIEQKYRKWILGTEETDYKNPWVQKRYLKILEYAEAANNKYDNFQFTSEEEFDFSTKANQKEAREIFAEILFPLSLTYHLPGDSESPNPFFQNKKTEEKILFLFNYLRQKGWKEGINMQYKNMDTYRETGVVGFGGSMGNNFLGYSLSVFLNKELLAEKNMLDAELKTLNWISSVVGPQFNFPKLWEVNGFNADGVRSMFNNRLCYVLSLPVDNPRRLEEAQYFSRLFNKSLQIADGWADLIKSDYMGYHHKNAYLSAYAPNAFHTASLMVYLLEGSSLQVNAKAIENLSKAILQMRIYSHKYDCPRALAGRFPDNLGGLVRNQQCFVYMAEIESPFKEEMKAAFTRLWDPSFDRFNPDYVENVRCKIMYHGSIGAMQMAYNLAIQNIEPENAPRGFWFYPYGGLGIYRQKNWLLSFKGNSKYIWDFESSGSENIYGRFVSAGALRILAGGNPVSANQSGYTVEGWNWNRLPNATTFDMPFDEMKSKKTRNFTPESYLGGVSAGEKNGLVSLKYDAPLSSLSLNKSFFFFDDYVVAVGTNINARNEDYPVQTTLYQNRILEQKEETSLNGEMCSGKQSQTINQENISLTDAQKHAYFIPGKSTVSVERNKQTAPTDNGKSEKSGDFASARILHGKNPENSSFLYFIKINGGQAGANELHEKYDKLFEVIQNDGNAHIVKYPSQNITGYAMLQGNINTNDPIISQTDVPCLVMIQEKNNNELSLSLQNPELGKIDQMISYGEISNRWHQKSTVQPVVLTLKGNWQIKQANDKIRIISSDKDYTKIGFNCFDGKVIQAELGKK